MVLFICKLVDLVNWWTLGMANSVSDVENAYKWAKNIYRQIKSLTCTKYSKLDKKKQLLYDAEGFI